MTLKKIAIFIFLLSAPFTHAALNTPVDTSEVIAPQQSLQDTKPPKHLDQPQIEPPFDKTAPAPLLLPLPSSREMTDSYEGAFTRMLATLIGLVALIFATFWFLRRMGKGKFKMSSSRTIHIIERKALSPKTMLYIVEIGDTKVLISESQVEVRTLTAFEELPEIKQ